MKTEEFKVIKCESGYAPLQKVLQLESVGGKVVKVPISRVCKIEISHGKTKIYCTTFER
jgi:hypothetical protein